MVARTLYAIDGEALTVLSSQTQNVGDTVINNSDSPDGTQYTFGFGFSTRQVTIEDRSRRPDTLEDDSHWSHVVRDGGGLITNGTGIEAESVIRLQQIDANGTTVGPVINIYVLSQNGDTSDVWGFASDTPLVPGADYLKVGGGNIGSIEYSAFQNSWLNIVDGTDQDDAMSRLDLGARPETALSPAPSRSVPVEL